MYKYGANFNCKNRIVDMWKKRIHETERSRVTVLKEMLDFPNGSVCENLTREELFYH